MSEKKFNNTNIEIDFKGCRDKAQTIPSRLPTTIQPQLKSVETLLEYIFDRNACLLPAVFIINEINKADHKKCPHWVIVNSPLSPHIINVIKIQNNL